MQLQQRCCCITSSYASATKGKADRPFIVGGNSLELTHPTSRCSYGCATASRMHVGLVTAACIIEHLYTAHVNPAAVVPSAGVWWHDCSHEGCCIGHCYPLKPWCPGSTACSSVLRVGYKLNQIHALNSVLCSCMHMQLYRRVGGWLAWAAARLRDAQRGSTRKASRLLGTAHHQRAANARQEVQQSAWQAATGVTAKVRVAVKPYWSPPAWECCSQT